ALQLAAVHSSDLRARRAARGDLHGRRHAGVQRAADAFPSAVRVARVRASDRRRVLHLDRILGPEVQRDRDRAVPVEHRLHARGVGAPHAPSGGIVSQAPEAGAEALAQQDGRSLGSITWIGVVLGVMGLVASLTASSRADFYFSWLVAYLYFLVL